MKQVLLDGRGTVRVVEVPAPTVEPGHVLVRTAYTLISSGTEMSAVASQSRGLVKRALARPDLVRGLARQVISDGLSSVKDRVTDHLERWNALGYSLAGTTMEVGPGVADLKRGARVACSGAEHAHHAEVVSVPARLAVRIPDRVNLRSAAFAPMAAIAMQGVRRSGAGLGETVIVLGLGLVGLLVCQILKAAGCHVLGMDVNEDRCRLGEQVGCDAAAADESSLSALCSQTTSGLGADAVIICAATASDSPVNEAFKLARERGRVVIVGDVGMDLSRDQFYLKELDLLMSRSLGPGRYDPQYEDRGVDYPPAYVRWTEARNMGAALSLMAGGRLDPDPLVSATFPVDNAPAAYAHLADSRDALAVVLSYDGHEDESPRPDGEVARSVSVNTPSPLAGRIGVGLVGVGSFAQSVHLPMLRRSPGFALRGVVSRRGPDAQRAARKFDAAYAATDIDELLKDADVKALWITTTHDRHADFAVRALEAGKHVFIEKPMALTLADCRRVVQVAQTTGGLATVGFNRRFAPASVVAREHFVGVTGSKEVVYRVRGDEFPKGHWIDDPVKGGGRLLGEGCHFFDWLAWFLNEEPVRVYAARAGGAVDGAAVTVEFSKGSVGTLVYTIAGSPGMPKERIEIFGGGRGTVIDDFRRVELGTRQGRWRKRRASGKGHAQQLDAFLKALRGEAPPAVTPLDGLRATACALAAQEALRQGIAQTVDLHAGAPAESGSTVAGGEPVE